MSSGWTPEKVARFRTAFFAFLGNIYIDSKEKGANYRLSDGLYDAQLRFLDGIFDGLANGIHAFLVLKSRQLGISTISEALFIFWLGYCDAAQAACILDSKPHLAAARMRIRNVISRLPAALKFPGIDRKNNSRDLLRLDNSSKVTWLAAGVRETESSGGLGRSEGINVVWASEVSSWKNEEGITSFIESLSETFENRLFIWESTARGYNHWRDMWLDAKKDDLNQKTIFIGWWAHPDHKIPKGDRRFERYGAKEPTPEERSKIDLVRERYKHEITIEQLAWHRYKMDPTRELEDGERKNDQFKQQENPTTEEECFTQAGSSFFDHIALNTHANRIQTYDRSKNYRYLFGAEFPSTIITPAIYWRDVQLRVWDPPDPGVQYIVAGDPAFGRNPDNDRSACQVLACYADCVEQVAEFASPTVNTDQFAWVVMSLAAWYKNVTLIVELDGPGEAVWKEIDSLPSKIRSPYMRKAAEDRGLLDVFNNVRNFIYSRSDSMSKRGNNWQWKTGNRKEPIMEKLRAFVATGQIIIKSFDTIEEMRSIARDGASIAAPSHKHDDRVLALAFGLRAWEDEVRPGLLTRGITKAAYTEARKMTSQGRYAIFMENTLSNLFNRNARIAKQAARDARRANMRRR